MLTETLLIAAAAWRMAALISYERGPFDIFLRLRERLNVTHDDSGVPISWPDGFITSLVSCVWCLSLWTALGLWGIYQWNHVVVIILAASAIAISIEQWNNK